MRLKKRQIDTLVKLIMKRLRETQSPIDLKAGENAVATKVSSVIEKNIQDEQTLDREVDRMLDQLEQDHGGEFQRYKMFGMLKKKLAEQQGFVL